MIQGAILEKGEQYYTRFGKIFHTLHNFQTEYNWLITDCVAYPQNERTAAGIEQAAHGSYNWFRGDELTELLEAEDFQWIWAVLSGFDPSIPKEEVLSVSLRNHALPKAVDYEGFWQQTLSIQHPLAAVELAAFDSSGMLLISRQEKLVKKFRQTFPLSEDLAVHNARLAQHGCHPPCM